MSNKMGHKKLVINKEFVTEEWLKTKENIEIKDLKSLKLLMSVE